MFFFLFFKMTDIVTIKKGLLWTVPDKSKDWSLIRVRTSFLEHLKPAKTGFVV